MSTGVDISIIVALHNKGPYVKATIQSVLEQTVSNWEVVVVENGSTDEGPDVVRSIEERRVRLLCAPDTVRGPGAARNYGLDRANGEWILFLDADDMIQSRHLEQLMGVATKHEDASIVAGGWNEFNNSTPSDLTNRRPAGESGSILDTAIAFSPWAVHAAITKRDLLERIRWPEDMDAMLAEDNAFWFSLCLEASVVYSPSNGALYRTQTANCRTRSNDVEKWFCGVHAAVERNLVALGKRGRQPNAKQSAALMQLYSQLYRQACEAGNSDSRRRALHEARCWLRASRQSGHRATPAMVLRSLVGIPVFEQIKSVLGV